MHLWKQQWKKYWNRWIQSRTVCCVQLNSWIQKLFVSSCTMRDSWWVSEWNMVEWESYLYCDFENFNFLHFENCRTREQFIICYATVVRINMTNARCVWIRICIALTGNDEIMSATKSMAVQRVYIDYVFLLFGCQCKCHYRSVVWILQCLKETYKGIVSFGLPAARFPLYSCETAENIPIYVKNEY
jgi:hypothetical protein